MSTRLMTTTSAAARDLRAAALSLSRRPPIAGEREIARIRRAIQRAVNAIDEVAHDEATHDEAERLLRAAQRVLAVMIDTLGQVERQAADLARRLRRAADVVEAVQ